MPLAEHAARLLSRYLRSVLLLAARATIAVTVTAFAGTVGVGVVLCAAWLVTTGGAELAALSQVAPRPPWLSHLLTELRGMFEEGLIHRQEIWKQSLGIGVTAFGGAALIGMLREISSVLPTLWNYVGGRTDFGDVVRAGGTVLVSMAALCLGIIGLKEVKSELPMPSAPTAASTIFLQMENAPRAIAVPAASESQQLTFILTFSGEATRASLLRGSGPGLELHPGYEEWLKLWVLDLASCASGEDKPITLKIAGFASSSDWRPKLREGASNRLNLRLANRRAAILYDRLRALLAAPELKTARGSRRIALQLHTWPSFEAMKQHRMFNDRITSTTYSPNRGRLNRRAEIWVDTVECAVDSSAGLEVASWQAGTPP